MWQTRWKRDRGPIGPRRLLFSAAGDFRVVHSQTSKFHQELPDRFYAQRLVDGVWHNLSIHRVDNAALRACERAARGEATPTRSELEMPKKKSTKTATRKTAKTATAKKPAAKKPATKRGAAKPAKAATESKPEKKLTAIDAAAKVLAESADAMTCKELIDVLAKKKLWTSPGGKTPDATLYSAIIREIRNKGSESRFTKTERGRFAYNR